MIPQQFVLETSRFKEIQKKMIVRGLPIMLLSLAAGLGIGYLNNSEQQDSPSFWLFMTPVFLMMLVFGLYRGIQRQKGLFTSYRLFVDGQGITREQDNTPRIHLASEEISGIYKAADGSYTVKGRSLNHTIIVPTQVENPAALEESLAPFGPLLAQPPLSVAIRALQLVPAVTLVLMILVYVSANKLVVAISGTVLLGALGYSFVATYRSKHIDGKTKKVIWFLPLVIASVLAVMYAKLTASL